MALIDYFLPLSCSSCQRFIETVCWDCLNQPSVIRQSLASDPSVTVIARFGYFNGLIKELIVRLKYLDQPWLGSVLGTALLDGTLQLDPVDFCLPVPMAADRWLERGYNQAKLLARASPCPLIDHLFIRLPSPRQAALSASERHNLAQVFAWRQPIPDWLAGSSVVIIDDVLTTGSTVSRLVERLREARVKEIQVLVLALAEPTTDSLPDAEAGLPNLNEGLSWLDQLAGKI